MKSKSDTISSFVSFIDDPKWVCKELKGFAFNNNLSKYKRCVPIGMLDEIETTGDFFRDASLEIAGVSSHSVMTYALEMPAFTNVQYVNKVNQHEFKILAGRPIRVSFSQNITGLLPEAGGDIAHLVSCEKIVYELNGKYTQAKSVKSNCEGGNDPSGHAIQVLMPVFASAFNERYNAHMEIPLKNGVSVSLPINLTQLKEVLRDRDKPESGDRRPSLINLVKAHKRTTQSDMIKVREHFRGKIECAWRGWNVTLYPSIYDIERLEKISSHTSKSTVAAQ